MKVVFDLDGTLALNEHRQHFVQGQPAGEKDWRGFFAACDKDEPNMPIIWTLLSLLDDGWEVEIWSGRSAEVNDKTEVWLKEQRLENVPRRMRQEGDYTPDHELKAKWLTETDPKPILVFDDRASVVAMWRSHGIICAQVAPGEF